MKVSQSCLKISCYFDIYRGYRNVAFEANSCVMPRVNNKDIKTAPYDVI